jgi:hypothetical protein
MDISLQKDIKVNAKKYRVGFQREKYVVMNTAKYITTVCNSIFVTPGRHFGNLSKAFVITERAVVLRSMPGTNVLVSLISRLRSTTAKKHTRFPLLHPSVSLFCVQN